MDYIFEEDVFEVGAEIEAYCSRCKTDTPHTVLTKYEDEIRSVQCSTCSSTHAYRPPRGESEEDIPEPISVRRRQGLQKLSWEEAMAQLNLSNAKLYTPAESFSEGEVLEHPVFGYGYVSDLVSDTKLEAHFRDGERILVYNRKDISIPLPTKRRSPPPVFAKAPVDKKRKRGEPPAELPKVSESKNKRKSASEAQAQAGASAKAGRAAKAAGTVASKPVKQPGKTESSKPAKAGTAKPAAKQSAKPAKKPVKPVKPARPAKPVKKPGKARKVPKPPKPTKPKATKGKPKAAAKNPKNKKKEKSSKKRR